MLPVAFEENRSGPRDADEGPGSPDPVDGPPDATAAVKGTTKGTAAAAPCPDPLLRPLVIGVESDPSGAPIWVLDDGRRLWRNPVAGKGPLLVPAPPRKKKGS